MTPPSESPTLTPQERLAAKSAQLRASWGEFIDAEYRFNIDDVDAVLRALESAQKDTARLDWLQSRGWVDLTHGIRLSDPTKRLWAVKTNDTPTARAETLREAIDAAISAPPPVSTEDQ